MKYQSLDKRAITVMRINACISFIFLLIGLILFYYFSRNMSEQGKTIFYIIGSILIILSLCNIILFPAIRYQRSKYILTREMIDVKKGLFRITRTVIPIERVQKIELTSGPIDRHYDLSTVIIYTAAGTVEIQFLNSREAKQITDELNQRIKESIYEIK